MVWSNRLINLLALAIFIPLSKASGLDVWNPTMYYPIETTVWHVGQRHNVRWRTDDAPVNITNSEGELYLVHLGVILLNHPGPLAKGFNIRDGSVMITVPKVESGVYQLLLLGDSGNTGPAFRIVN